MLAVKLSYGNKQVLVILVWKKENELVQNTLSFILVQSYIHQYLSRNDYIISICVQSCTGLTITSFEFMQNLFVR